MRMDLKKSEKILEGIEDVSIVSFGVGLLNLVLKGNYIWTLGLSLPLILFWLGFLLFKIEDSEKCDKKDH